MQMNHEDVFIKETKSSHFLRSHFLYFQESLQSNLHLDSPQIADALLLDPSLMYIIFMYNQIGLFMFPFCHNGEKGGGLVKLYK